MSAKIKFIGTGSGKTSLKRFHSSFLILNESYNLLVDTGDGISKALLLQNINYNSIDGILISHLHPDHYTGLPLLLVQM
ncbi:MAG: MBL fold metallo-hydrolase, partial [Ignavibacteriaceae bacterium]